MNPIRRWREFWLDRAIKRARIVEALRYLDWLDAYYPCIVDGVYWFGPDSSARVEYTANYTVKLEGRDELFPDPFYAPVLPRVYDTKPSYR